jgi:type IV secretion system protein VirD4
MIKHDILLGRQGDAYIKFGGDEHVIAYAKTGQGKTTGLVIPNCFHWKGSLVVLDIKREIFAATAGHRIKMGQEVYLLDPAAEEGRTHRWNPLSEVNRTSDDRFDQISRVSFMLFPDQSATGGGGTTNTDKFWEPAGRSAYNAVTTIIAETPELPLNHATVLRMFSRGDGSEILIRMIAKRRREGGPQYSQAAVDGVSDFLAGNLDQVEGVRKVVSTKLQPWFNHRIANATLTSDFSLRDLRRRPMTIYVAVNPGNMTRMRPYLSLFFEQLVNLNVEKTPEQDPSLQHQALIVLDEFARLGHMPTLAEAAQYGRGFGLRMIYVVQNRPQVEARYGQAGAMDIFDNTGAEIVFGTNDLKTTEEVSKRIGDNTTSAITKQRPRIFPAFQWNKQSEAEHLHRRPMMLPQEVARMGNDQQIILRAGMQACVTDRQGWFKDPALVALHCPPPVIPRIPLPVATDDGQTRIVRPKPRHISGVTAQDVEPVETGECD